MNRLKTAAAALGIGAVIVAGASACSSNTMEAQPSTAATVVGSATDIAFAQAMIPHHQQAVEMADMALDPKADASPAVKRYAEEIKQAQGPEIDQMTTWLQSWGAPTAMPGASGDMHGMDHSGHDMGGMTMSGMMTPEDMQTLSTLSGQPFDTMWLEMMIAHHEGAIQMAEQVKSETSDPEVEQLANDIITAQEAEIEQMRKTLDA